MVSRVKGSGAFLSPEFIHVLRRAGEVGRHLDVYQRVQRLAEWVTKICGLVCCSQIEFFHVKIKTLEMLFLRMSFALQYSEY